MLIRTSLIFFFLFALTLVLPAQSPVLNDASTLGLGGISVTSTDCWSARNNPAGMPFIREATIGAHYHNPLFISKLSNKALAISQPAGNGNVGLIISQFGYSLFQQLEAGIAFGERISEQLSLGASISWFRLQLGQGYGSYNGITGSVGILVRMNEQLTVGGHTYNLNNARQSDYRNERIPSVHRLGIKYLLSAIAALHMEAEKMSTGQSDLKIGISYQPATFIQLRTGIRTSPTRYAFGFGMQFGQFRTDLGFSYHLLLGYQPAISITWKASSREN